LLDGHAGELASGGEALSWFAVTTHVPSGLHPERIRIFSVGFHSLATTAAKGSGSCPLADGSGCSIAEV
jgi:hypothetical protein